MASIQLTQHQIDALADGATLEISHPHLGQEGYNGTIWIRQGHDIVGDVEIQ